MNQKEDKNAFIKNELLKHVDGNMAFLPLSNMLAKIPFKEVGIRPHNLPYSFYELFYHIVFAQEDILNFISTKAYNTPKWPKDYWPTSRQPENEKAWEALKDDYNKNYKKIHHILTEENQTLNQAVKHASDDSQTLLREVLLIINHTAYHTGQLLIVLRLLDLHP